jgi:hypothetical protein
MVGPVGGPTMVRASLAHAPLEATSSVHFANPGHGKKPANGTQGSLDWAGYAVTGPVYSNVSGSWTEPAASCTANKVEQAAFWVGIDGYSTTNTVEQIGTDSDCTKGKGKKAGGPNYYAWYQMFPLSDVVLSQSLYPVAPGDSIAARVSVAGSTYTLTITDGSKWHFSTTQTPLVAPPNSSAEWIAEAPSSCNGTKCKVLPLANFGSITFTGASANGQAISWSGFTNYQINMTNKSGKKTKAQPSALGSGGTAFSVAWKSN